MHTIGLFERAYRRLTAPLPAALSSKLDLMRPAYVRGWGGPMNGQAGRQRIVRDLLAAIPFDHVVETGTFRGGTTQWLNEVSNLPVDSVETVKRFYLFAKAQSKNNRTVRLHLGDSRKMLREFAGATQASRPFFYLDAHWEEDVPRHDELRIVHQRWPECVVMIDDFRVPGDDGYGYALYGGKALDETYLPDLPGWTLFYPSAPSREETGSRRGCAVFASEPLAERVRAITGLREARRWA